MSRDLNFQPLARNHGLRGRARAVGANPLWVMGGMIGVLLVVIPSAVFVALLLDGRAYDDWGVVALVAMLVAAGAFCVGQVLHEAGRGSALAAFAHANELDLVVAKAQPGYAGSLFADGSHIVQQSVRTQDARFVEVGERFPVTGPQRRGAPATPELFLRGRLAGRSAPWATTDAGPELHERLTAFAGTYVVEVFRDELTVFGSKRLDPTRPGRMAEALALTDALVAEADDRIPASARDHAPAVPEFGEGGRGRRTHPGVVVAATLALLVVVPLTFAFVMSILENWGAPVPLKVLAVSGGVSLVLVVVRAVVRRLTADPLDRAAGRRPVWPWIVAGAVAFVALGAFAIGLDSASEEIDDGINDDDAKSSPAECAADDPWCQWDVSTRLWADEVGLARVDFDGLACGVSGVEESECLLRVACEDGYADLTAVLAGTPYEVVGVRAFGTAPDAPLTTTPAQVSALVARACQRD